jgi:hypothetical protein
MGKTRNGIYYNLCESEYKLTINHITYYFSSSLYRKKFIERYLEERDILSYTQSRRFKATLNLSVLADLKTYSNIEKRGFLVEIEGVYYKCLDNINLQLEQRTLSD